MQDEISNAFEDLTPEQFIQPSSSASERAITRASNQGAKKWTDWVDNALEAVRMTAIIGPPDLLQFSMLQNGQLRRYFVGEPDETTPMYAERLTREAQLMGATWFFNVMIAPGASHYAGEPNAYPIDPDDQESIDQALENGRLSICLCWHAAMREGEHHHARSGVIPIVGDELGAGTEGNLDPESNIFAGVLSAE